MILSINLETTKNLKSFGKEMLRLAKKVKTCGKNKMRIINFVVTEEKVARFFNSAATILPIK